MLLYLLDLGKVTGILQSDLPINHPRWPMNGVTLSPVSNTNPWYDTGQNVTPLMGHLARVLLGKSLECPCEPMHIVYIRSKDRMGMSTWALKGANHYIVLLDLRPVILIHEIFHCCNDQKITS